MESHFLLSGRVSVKNVLMNWKPILASMDPGTMQAMKELIQQEQDCSCMQGTVRYEVRWQVDYV